jgi:hypothetical protein
VVLEGLGAYHTPSSAFQTTPFGRALKRRSRQASGAGVFVDDIQRVGKGVNGCEATFLVSFFFVILVAWEGPSNRRKAKRLLLINFSWGEGHLLTAATSAFRMKVCSAQHGLKRA